MQLDEHTAIRFYLRPAFYRGKLNDFDVVLYDVTRDGQPEFAKWDCDVTTPHFGQWRPPMYVTYLSADRQVSGFAPEDDRRELRVVYELPSHLGAPGMRDLRDLTVQREAARRMVDKLNEANDHRLKHTHLY